MKVECEFKITFQDGKEAGKVICDKKIYDTETQVTEYGIIERLRFEWNYIHDTRLVNEGGSE